MKLEVNGYREVKAVAKERVYAAEKKTTRKVMMLVMAIAIVGLVAVQYFTLLVGYGAVAVALIVSMVYFNGLDKKVEVAARALWKPEDLQ